VPSRKEKFTVADLPDSHGPRARGIHMPDFESRNLDDAESLARLAELGWMEKLGEAGEALGVVEVPGLEIRHMDPPGARR
jgi:hypothetical protein